MEIPPALREKIGPLPAWQWGVIGLAGVGVVAYVLKRRKTTAVTLPPQNNASNASLGSGSGAFLGDTSGFGSPYTGSPFSYICPDGSQVASPINCAKATGSPTSPTGPGPTSCGPGQSLLPGTSQCVDSLPCPPGQSSCNGGLACCGGGSSPINLVPTSGGCGPGTSQLPGTSQCVPTLACPPGQHSCQGGLACCSDQGVHNTVNPFSVQCPSGTVMLNGACIQLPTLLGASASLPPAGVYGNLSALFHG